MNSQQIRALPLPAGWYWGPHAVGVTARRRPASEVEQVVFDVAVRDIIIPRTSGPGIVRRVLGRIWPSLLPPPAPEERAMRVRFRTEAVHRVAGIDEDLVLSGELSGRFTIDINTFDFDRFEEYLALIEADRLAEALE